MKTAIITRKEAMEYLRRRKHPRGPGSSGDYINYGLVGESGKILAVARIAPAPYGNAPVKAVLGPWLAPRCVYLARQFAAGITHADLVMFVREYTLRMHADLAERGHDIRYMLSMDDTQDHLIDLPLLGLRKVENAVTGRVYVEAGALYAGKTRSSHNGRYVDANGQTRSTYQSGKNITAQVAAQGLPLIAEYAKQRFLFILAPEGSLAYRAWRNDLPPVVRAPVWGQDSLGWKQPRLLGRLLPA